MSKKTVTFGLPATAVIDMERSGCPLPSTVQTPTGRRRDRVVAITCTEREADAIIEWLFRQPGKSVTYEGIMSLIERMLEAMGRRR